MRDSAFVTAYVLRGARLWLLTRTISSAVMKLGGVNPFNVTLPMAAWMVTVTVALGWIEVGRKHERAFLQNLGIPTAAHLALVGVPAVAGEAALALLWALAR